MEKKVIILDFDGTLYSGEHKFDLIPDIIKNNKREFLPHLTDDEYSQICESVPSWNAAIFGSEISKAIIEIKDKFPNLNVSTKDFYDWQDNHIDPIIIDKEETVDLKFLKKLCKEYPTYIVSNSAPHHIDFYMKKIGVKKNWFVDIISNPFSENDTTKRPCYQSIADRENIKTSQLYVFGDSRTSDLAPAQLLSATTGHVRDARLIPYMVNSALSLDTSIEKQKLLKLLEKKAKKARTSDDQHKLELLQSHIAELGILDK